jgi:hypothetical protein
LEVHLVKRVFVYGGNEVKKRMVIAVAFAVLLAVSAYAQMTDFEKLVITGTPQSIQAAIEKGVDVNTIDKQGWTPLLIAAANNPNPDVIAALLKAGATLHPAYGWIGTALMAAAMGNKNPEIIITLLNDGEDINARTIDRRTALMFAAENNPNPEVITTLLKAGADPIARSKEGKTASDYALESGLLTGTDAYRQLSEAQPRGKKYTQTTESPPCTIEGTWVVTTTESGHDIQWTWVFDEGGFGSLVEADIVITTYDTEGKPYQKTVNAQHGI